MSILRLLGGLFACFLIAVFGGCLDSPFPTEHPEYTAAFIIDRSSSYDDYLATTAFTHFARVKDVLSRDLGGSESLVIVSQINGNGHEAVMFEGSFRAFSQRFPTKEAFSNYLNQTPLGSSPVYRSVAETVERLCRRHQEYAGTRSLLLIYSDMGDTHGGKENMDAAVKKYATYRSAIGVYGANEQWADYFKQLGVRHSVAYDPKRADPPLPEIP